VGSQACENDLIHVWTLAGCTAASEVTFKALQTLCFPCALFLRMNNRHFRNPCHIRSQSLIMPQGLNFASLFFFSSYRLLSNHSRLKAGSFVAKRWKADGKTYFGVVDEVSYGDNNALQSVSISYVDGDHEDHHCDDSSFDSNDFRIVPVSVPQGGAGDLVHMVDLAGAHIRSTLVKQMEARLWDKLHSFITQRSTNVRLGSWCRVTLKWSRDEHRLYFASIEPRQLQTDAEMIAILFPYKGALPWKRIGHRKQEPNQLQRIVVCAKGFVKHTKDHTTVKFAYARFDLIDGVWVNRWVQPDGAPWDKKD
jgi:hypothetical protein